MYFNKLSDNTKQNKKLTQNIQQIHKETIHYAKLLQDAYKEKKRMETYLQQVSTNEQQNKTFQTEAKTTQKNEVNSLKKELEKITKNFNTISSQNQKKRSEISTLRKERTLYDHLFKTLEYQILHQEKDLLEYIQKNDKEQKQIILIERNLQNIKDLVKKNAYAEFYRIIEQEKQKYLKEITEPYKQKNLQHRQTLHCLQTKNTQKQLDNLQKQGSNNSLQEEEQKEIQNNIMQDQELEKKQHEIMIVDQTIAEFKYYTEGIDIEFIKNFVEDGEKINSELYEQFCELEGQLQLVKLENNKLEKQLLNEDQNLDENDEHIIKDFQNIQNQKLQDELNNQQQKLEETLVFQKENISYY